MIKQTDQWVEVQTCLALAGLYDDPNPIGGSNFEVPWDWRGKRNRKDINMAIIGSDPSDRFKKLLDKFDREGMGYHLSIMNVAGIMKAMNLPSDKAKEMMHKASENVSRRDLQSGEIEKAVDYCYNHIAHGKHFVKERPSVDHRMIERYSEVGDIEELRKQSKEIPQHPHELLLNLYDGKDIIHVSKDLFNGQQMEVDTLGWEMLEDMQYICPNPLKKADDGRVLMNIAQRRYAVFESDIEELAGKWDAQAGVIEKLKSILRLSMIVWSGNKSLHAWFDCRGHAESQVHRFDNMAIRLGADPQSLRMTQLVRFPWGKRDNGKVQKVIYYDG